MKHRLPHRGLTAKLDFQSTHDNKDTGSRLLIYMDALCNTLGLNFDTISRRRIVISALNQCEQCCIVCIGSGYSGYCGYW